jgi:hypothetical protein
MLSDATRNRSAGHDGEGDTSPESELARRRHCSWHFGDLGGGEPLDLVHRRGAVARRALRYPVSAAKGTIRSSGTRISTGYLPGTGDREVHAVLGSVAEGDIEGHGSCGPRWRCRCRVGEWPGADCAGHRAVLQCFGGLGPGFRPPFSWLSASDMGSASSHEWRASIHCCRH